MMHDVVSSSCGGSAAAIALASTAQAIVTKHPPSLASLAPAITITPVSLFEAVASSHAARHFS
jgi:hypothetical protein